jgi:hypothetical protein
VASPLFAIFLKSINLTLEGGSPGNIISVLDIETGLRIRSSYNTIEGNTVWSIFLENAHSNTIISNNCGHLRLGYINQTSSYNVISGNKINPETRSLYAILIGNSSHNVFYNNYIVNSQSTLGGGNGVVFGSESSYNNSFYHNSFIGSNNHVIVYDGDSLGSNFWDNGNEGNYWEYFSGADANGDGIADSPYVIDANNVDRYPLMKPWSEDVPQRGLGAFQTILIVIIIAVLVVVGAVLTIYFRRKNSL